MIDASDLVELREVDDLSLEPIEGSRLELGNEERRVELRRLVVQPARAGRLEAEAWIVGGVAQNEDDRLPDGQADLETTTTEPRSDSLPMPPGIDRNRAGTLRTAIAIAPQATAREGAGMVEGDLRMMGWGGNSRSGDEPDGE